MNTTDELLQCDQHGLQPFSIVCQHLSTATKSLGFHQQANDGEQPDAWCNTCHERWQKQNGSENEREQWEDECAFKIVCSTCYTAIKEKNGLEPHFDLSVLSFSEIKQQLIQKSENRNKLIALPSFLPKKYLDLIAIQATQEISIECKLLSLKDAIELNKHRATKNEWIFASVETEYWSFTSDHHIIYYEKEQNNIVSKKLNINFEEWLQLAFLLKKLDHIQQHYIVTIVLQHAFQNNLYAINPTLKDHFSDMI